MPLSGSMPTSSGGFEWHPLWTAIEVVAAVVFLLQFLGVFQLLRRKLLPRFQAVSDIPHARFFNVGRSLFLGAFVLTLVLGFIDSQPARLAIAGSVFLVVVTKEVIDWRRDVAVLQAATEAKPQEIALQPATAISSATLDLTTPEVSNGEAVSEEDEAIDDLPPPKRTRAVITQEGVELSVVVGGGVLPVGKVTCEVTHPVTGLTYRASASPTLDNRMGLLVGVLAPRRVVLQYPTEFDGAPPGLAKGVYRVRWEIPSPGGLGFGSIEHDAFRIEH